MAGALSREFLEELYARHHRIENLSPDPLVFVRRHRNPKEGEVAGLLAASFAYGRVGKIMEALTAVFQRLGPTPAATLLRSDPSDIMHLSDGFAYRFQKHEDLAIFLWLVRQALDRWGGLRELFGASDDGQDIGAALTAFSEAILAGDPRPFLTARRLPRAHPVRHLLSSPGKGGAAKRLCLYLRWMCRRDELDPGYWHGAVDPARLVIPLDTHVARVAQALLLTARKTPDWRMALEITGGLRQYDPVDPIRFDFSLFRFGMGRAKGANVP